MNERVPWKSTKSTSYCQDLERMNILCEYSKY